MPLFGKKEEETETEMKAMARKELRRQRSSIRTTREEIFHQLHEVELQMSKQWDYCIVFDVPEDARDGVEASDGGEARNKLSADLKRFITLFTKAGLTVSKSKSLDGDEIYIKLGCPLRRLLVEAERIDLPLPLKSADGDDDFYSTAFKVRKFESFQNSDNPAQFFRSAQRQNLILSIIEADHHSGGCGIVPLKEIEAGNMKQFFPLHDISPTSIRDELRKDWVRGYFKAQPLDEIRGYFGEKIAIYFAFLGFYTTWLVLPSIFGLIIFVVGLGKGSLDLPITPFFAIFMSLWATLFLEFWKRKNNELAFEWDVMDFEEEEKVRPEFRGETRISPVTDEEEAWYPEWRRKVKEAVGASILAFMVCIVIISVIAIMCYRVFAAQEWATTGKISAGVVNGLVITILNVVYKKIAFFLNSWENHRTQTAYEDALITKTFCFQFINSYASLFYIAFFKRDASYGWLGYDEHDKCEPDCLTELTSQLGSILLTKQIFSQVMEIGVPYVKGKISLWKEKRAAASAQEHLIQDGQEREIKLAQWEKESKLPVYESPFEDYNEMIIQFGYITLFVAAFPVAPFAALLNNVIEVRTDAHKLTNIVQRPPATGAEDMGTWQVILEVMSVVAVITNVLIVGFTSTVLREHLCTSDGNVWDDAKQECSAPIDDRTRFTYLIIAEHLVFLLKFGMAVIVPDVPADVQIAIDRERYEGKKALEGEDEDLDAVDWDAEIELGDVLHISTFED